MISLNLPFRWPTFLGTEMKTKSIIQLSININNLTRYLSLNVHSNLEDLQFLHVFPGPLVSHLIFLRLHASLFRLFKFNGLVKTESPVTMPSII
jgi:hypothetical protein